MADVRETTRLTPAQLRWRCPELKPSKKPPGAATLLGQDRPMRALHTGLGLYGPGYNVFVSGLMGTGRTTVVQTLLRELQPVCRLGPDRVYVNSLREPNRPKLLTLPRGRGPEFRDEMLDFVKTIQDSLQMALRSRHHQTSRRLLIRSTEARERRMMQALSREAQKNGCALVQFTTESGVMTADIYPVHEGEAVALDTLSALVREGKVDERMNDDMMARRDQLLVRLAAASERVQRIYRKTELELRRMDRLVATRVLQRHTKDFRTRWTQEEVADYLSEVHDYVARDLDRWVMPPEEEHREPEAEPGSEPGHPHEGAPPPPHPPPQQFQELAVHVVKTNEDGDECPVVIEINPTYGNMFGTIEHPRDGLAHNVGLIHPGALLKADGGYLVLRAHDVLREPGAWLQLKRALQVGKLEIREYDPNSGTTGGVLQPEAIPIDLKVVMIGEPGVYEALATEDPQFRQIFKVHAEFDTTIPNNPANLRRYADYLAYLSNTEGLRNFSPEAAAAVAEEGARSAGRQDRLTTRFGEIGDMAREASHLCERDGSGPVLRRHVDQALSARVNRHDLHREWVERDFKDGYTRLSTTGVVVGQINALTVVDTGTLAFGRPSRITASTGVGSANRSGLINIEREAELSGPIHDKGVMILEGFLLETFGHLGAPCLQATLCFEQLYSGLDGDSASCAELVALLSSLSGVPVDQGLAITGSVNQKGDVQAVSGVDEKIEGYFRICKARRLTGKQGVILPRVNVSDLMLDLEVVEAVERGRFHIHAIDHVHQGLELFTGRPADEILGEAAAALERFRALGRDK